MKELTPIHETVREHYAERIKNNDACCGSSTCCSSESSLYPADLLTTLPEGESAISYGCGDPITLASLQPGQVVLDLGSGAGLDCFLAAKKVGDTGRAIGVDMTPEMIERATASAKRLGITNVDFRQGYLEELPVDSSSVDVIISNCVINLAPDKAAVFAEAYRVLKPGGKLAVSDIVTDGPLPEEVKQSLSAWAGCVAGAVDARDYIAMMETAGFRDVTISPVYFDKETVDSALADMKLESGKYPLESIQKTVYSAKITAIRAA
jgi:SAM-dependent methyltransferase